MFKLSISTQQSLNLALKDNKNIKSAIAPYGFELLNIYDVPHLLLRRIYIYISSEESEDRLLKFLNDFYFHLQEIYPELGNRISFIKYNKNIIKVKDKSKEFIQIYLTNIDTQETLINHYADYINLSSKYIMNNNHPQVIKFNDNLVSRGHILQLFLMHQEISKFYKTISFKIRDSDNLIVRKFIRKLSEEWGKTDEKASLPEKEILQDVIIPYFTENENYIKELCVKSINTNLKSTALHGEDKFERNTPDILIKECRKFVSSKYYSNFNLLRKN